MDHRCSPVVRLTASGSCSIPHTGEVLLSPEVVASVGSNCQMAPAPEGHALLLGVSGGTPSHSRAHTPSPRSNMGTDAKSTNAKAVKQKAGQELMALPSKLQLQAVQVKLPTPSTCGYICEIQRCCGAGGAARERADATSTDCSPTALPKFCQIVPTGSRLHSKVCSLGR